MKIEPLSELLKGTPYSLLDEGADTVTDPVLFLQGSPATVADLKAGWSVARTLAGPNGSVGDTDFYERLAAAPAGSLSTLRASTGEGKTTFLRKLVLALSPATSVIQWDLRGNKPALLEAAINDLGHRVVVVAELAPSLEPSAIVAASHQISAMPLPCPLLVAGAPRELSLFKAPAGQYTFEPLSTVAASALVDQMRRVLREHDAGAVAGRLPNLPTFIASPDLSLLCSGSLLPSLLKAVYGVHFTSRIRDEYLELGKSSSLAQRVYGALCVCHAIGLPLPLNIVYRLFENEPSLATVLAEHQGGAPWLHDRRGDFLTSRSPLVADCVMTHVPLAGKAAFSSHISAFFDAADPHDVADVGFMRALVAGYADWIPNGGDPESLKGGRRQALRAQVKRHAAWFDAARRTVRAEGDYSLVVDWCATLYGMLPDRPVAAGDTSAVLGESRNWLELAREKAPDSQLTYVQYLLGKNRLIVAEMEGDATDTRPALLEEWEQFLPQRVMGPGFHVDLIVLASTEFEHQSRVEDRLRLARCVLRTSTYAAMFDDPHLRMVTERAVAKVLHRVRGNANVTAEEFVALLKEGWLLSVSLGRPDKKTGVWLAEEVARTDVDEAKGILLKVLANTAWGDALFVLNQIAGGEPTVAKYVRDRGNEPDWKWAGALSAALAAHATAYASRVLNDDDGYRVGIQQACELYLDSSRHQLTSMWPIHGSDRWKAAATELARFDKEAGSVMLGHWYRAQKEVTQTLPHHWP